MSNYRLIVSDAATYERQHEYGFDTQADAYYNALLARYDDPDGREHSISVWGPGWSQSIGTLDTAQYLYSKKHGI